MARSATFLCKGKAGQSIVYSLNLSYLIAALNLMFLNRLENWLLYLYSPEINVEYSFEKHAWSC
jgi:hypothetical protein